MLPEGAKNYKAIRKRNTGYRTQKEGASVTEGAFFPNRSIRLIIIIMYIYHALVNALSAHMIHVNLNMICYHM